MQDMKQQYTARNVSRPGVWLGEDGKTEITVWAPLKKQVELVIGEENSVSLLL